MNYNIVYEYFFELLYIEESDPVNHNLSDQLLFSNEKTDFYSVLSFFQIYYISYAFLRCVQ